MILFALKTLSSYSFFLSRRLTKQIIARMNKAQHRIWAKCCVSYSALMFYLWYASITLYNTTRFLMCTFCLGCSWLHHQVNIAFWSTKLACVAIYWRHHDYDIFRKPRNPFLNYFLFIKYSLRLNDNVFISGVGKPNGTGTIISNDTISIVQSTNCGLLAPYAS